MRTLVLVSAAVALATAPALAQSRRYPPDPPDKDREEAATSALWESATHPQLTPHAKLVTEARAHLAEKTPAGALAALHKLDEAIRLVPNEPTPYLMAGEASFGLKDWNRCARDLHGAWTNLRRNTLDLRQTIELRRKLGVCQARAGRLADAERTLAEAAVSGNASGEVWMRLGEVRIAMGKLDEAIAALESAGEQPEPPVAMIRWLLAGAYDRARRPAEAIEAVRRAVATDRTFSVLRNEAVPLLGAGEAEYLQGLAYTTFEQPRPDYALVYFRAFLKVAKDSPWRKRAEEHLRELRTAELPEVVEKRGGNAPVDPAAVLAPVRRAMPAMRACAARTPYLIYEVTITKAGPRTPINVGDRPRSFAPPEVVNVIPVVDSPATGEVSQADHNAVVRCIEPIASRLVFPPIKDRDTYYRLAFHVIAP